MRVQRRALAHQRVHIGNGHEDPGAAVRQRLGHRQLIQIAGVIIVDGCPQQAAQVAHAAGRRGGRFDRRQFRLRGRRKIGLEPALEHRVAGYCCEGGPVCGLSMRGPRGLVARGGVGRLGFI